MIVRERYVGTLFDQPVAGIPSRSNGAWRQSAAEWDGFAEYLREVRRMSQTTVRSRVSNCKRVAKFEGDLSGHFERDECRNLLEGSVYTTRYQF